jgi:hypothetical protein
LISTRWALLAWSSWRIGACIGTTGEGESVPGGHKVDSAKADRGPLGPVGSGCRTGKGAGELD